MGLGSGVTYPRVIELLEEAVRTKGQRAVSREANVPLLGIQRYLKGNSKPTLETLQKLADYFGVSVAYLRGEIDNTPAIVAGLIGEALEKLGIEVLSKATGVSPEKIQLYSNRDGIPTESDLDKLSEYFKMSKHELRGGINELHMEFEVRRKMMMNELKSNEKIIDHLHKIGSTLVDARLVENQEEVLKDLTLRQGQIVGELKEMGIDILSDPEQQDKKI